MLVVSGLASFATFSGEHVLDLTLYRNTAAQLLHGQLPYRDFPLEYPPLAVVPFTIAALFSGPSVDLGRFAWNLLVENAVICAIIALSIAHLVRRVSGSRSISRRLVFLALLVGIGGPLFPFRYDLFPAMLTVIATLAALSAYPVVAGTALGLGIDAKVYPLVLLPIFCAFFLASDDRRALRRFGLASCAAVLLPLLPFLLLAPSGLLAFIEYHQSRGLQIESLWSGLLLLGRTFGVVSASPALNHGAFHLVSPAAPLILAALPLLSIGSLSILWYASWLRFRSDHMGGGKIGQETFLRYVVASLLVFIVTNKVFSPQYVVWLLRFVPLLSRRDAAFGALIIILTILLYPFHARALVAFDPSAILILNVRNALTVALLISLVRASRTRGRTVTQTPAR